MNKNKIYVVFSSTPYIMGNIIRFFTRYSYNHASIAMDSDLKHIYSCARYHCNASMYGGFIEESLNRFTYKGKPSKIKICEIELNDQQYENVENYLNDVIENRKEYIYNMFSAFLVPFCKKLPIEKAYTCVEFTISVLVKSGAVKELDEKKFYQLKELEKMVDEKIIFEGYSTELMQDLSWGNDPFKEDQTRIEYFKKTMSNIIKLVKRMIGNILA